MSVALAGQALIERPIGLGWGSLADFIGSVPLAFCNLEAGAVAPGGWPTKTKTLHLASREALASLAALGFRVLGHANNHAFDHGPPGILETRAAAAGSGLAITGSGMDCEDAGRPAILTAGGRRVAFLAADCGPQPEIVYASVGRAGINPLRMRRHLSLPETEFRTLHRVLAAVGEEARQQGRAAIGYRTAIAEGSLDFFGLAVARGPEIADVLRPDMDDLQAFLGRLATARGQADLVVVSLHHHYWEVDWSRTPGWFLSLAAALIDAGAEVVVGTGAPVLQPIRFHRGKPILAGLGNLVFHTHRPRRYDENGIDVWSSAVCRCVFAQGSCTRVEILPIEVGRPELRGDGAMPPPRPLAGEAARRVFERLTAGLPDGDRERCVRV